MPRDGSGNYTLPYPAVVDGTTIESAVHNGTMSDIALQLNGPVPIIAGGTGANNAHDAMIALKGEIALQRVTNYDTFPFFPGSFSSTPGATSEPFPGSYALGICYAHADDLNAIYLEARIYNGVAVIGPKMVRHKASGSGWTAWVEQSGSVADLDARYVNATGDTMTGMLHVNMPGTAATFGNGGSVVNSSVQINLNGGDAGGGGAFIRYSKNNTSKWANGLKSSIFGSPDVSDDFVYYSNAIGPLFTLGHTTGVVSVPATIPSTSPTTGALTVAGGVGIGGALQVGSAGVTSPLFYVAGANSYLKTDDRTLGAGHSWANYAVNGLYRILSEADGTDRLRINEIDGSVALTSTLASSSPTTGALTVAGGLGVGGALFSGSVSTGSATLSSSGTALWLQTGNAVIGGTTVSSSSSTGALTVAGGVGIGGAVNISGALVITGGGVTSASGGVFSGNVAINSSMTFGSVPGLTPNIIRVGALIDTSAGRGFSLGVASTSDPGVGYTDVIYSAAYSGPTVNCPVAAVYGLSTATAVNLGSTNAGALRIHCVTPSTNALVDPLYYTFHAIGS